MWVIDRILGFYEDIREFNSSNIKDFRGRLKSWIKMGMLAGRIFYLKDMWARDVAALTFASFMAMIPFMAMMFVIARGFGYASLLESWLSTTSRHSLLWRRPSLTSFTIISRIRRATTSSVRVS